MVSTRSPSLPGGVNGEPKVIIRAMGSADVAWAADLEAEIFSDAWSITMIAEEVLNPLRRYIVAELDGTPVGFAGLWVQPENAEIMTIGVSLESRDRGIGRALLRRLIEEAHSAVVDAILLEVRVDNESAKRLYESEGFTYIGVRRRYYAPDGCDADVMRLLLNSPYPGSRGGVMPSFPAPGTLAG